jgi:hypothetical protein
MEIALYILSSFFLLLLFLLFLPLGIRINNIDHIYEIDVFNILKIRPVYDECFENYIYINLNFLFFDFKYDIISKIAKNGKPKKKKQLKDENKKKNRKKRNKNIDIRKILLLVRELLMSFKIHHFKLNIDTNNYILNGILIPVFAGIESSRTKLNINFNQQYEIDLKISNKIANVIFPLIKFFIFKRS